MELHYFLSHIGPMLVDSYQVWTHRMSIFAYSEHIALILGA